MNSTTENKRISVVLSTYNGNKYLTEQLESICKQTRLPSELIVCDDASTDNTWSIIENFAKKAPCDFRIFRNVFNLGSTRSFEKCIRLATGDIVALCDQDDIWYPEKLAVTYDEISKPDVILTFSNADVVDGNGKSIGVGLWDTIGFSEKMIPLLDISRAFSLILRQNIVTGCTVAFFRRNLNLVLPFCPYWVHDYWITIILSLFGRLQPIPTALLSYRQHDHNQIGVDLESIKRGNVAPWQGSIEKAKDVHYSLSTMALRGLDNHLCNYLLREDFLPFHISPEVKNRIHKLSQLVRNFIMKDSESVIN